MPRAYYQCPKCAGLASVRYKPSAERPILHCTGCRGALGIPVAMTFRGEGSADRKGLPLPHGIPRSAAERRGPHHDAPERPTVAVVTEELGRVRPV